MNTFSASSYSKDAKKAGLNDERSAWRASETDMPDDVNILNRPQQGPWLQVDFGRAVYVTRIETRGFNAPRHSSEEEYVKKYKVAYKQRNNEDWKPVLTTESDGDPTTVCQVS